MNSFAPEFQMVPKVKAGDRVAVLSPAFAAPAVGLAVHEQAMRRLTEVLGLVPVEYPTTRQLGASPQARAADFTAAFADHSITAVMSTIGGNDLVTVVPFIEKEIVTANPKPFLGYSDNTNLTNMLWKLGIPSFYGGSTQVHIGPGTGIDEIHLQALQAALFTGGILELTDPGISQDFGLDWANPQALTEFGEFESSEPWEWFGPAKTVTGRTWGGCLEVLVQLAIANRFPTNEALAGTILLLETAEDVPPVDWVGWGVRSLGERGLLAQVAGVLVARPPASALFGPMPSPSDRQKYRQEQRDIIVQQIAQYNPDAVICVGVSFGHTRPQWIVPYGGYVTLDGKNQQVFADYS